MSNNNIIKHNKQSHEELDKIGRNFLASMQYLNDADFISSYREIIANPPEWTKFLHVNEFVDRELEFRKLLKKQE